ncbi:MAG: hypothetical protein NC936_01905 [Candidatus Omnitrophica bacterium]|nr:hypothetical protein [Candidatus Omnitrophota bacterium]
MMALILLSITSVLLGSFMFLKPSYAIELQRRFYLKINWKMEPVSMPLEIRNTKIMGLFLIIFSFAIAAYIFIAR